MDTPGTPPPQDVDIVEAGYAGETEDSLLFFVSLARLDPSWPFLTADGEGELGLHYGLCWAAHIGQTCDRALRLDVWLHAGKPATQATFELSSSACGPRGLCVWPVAATFEAGMPGTIHFLLPKALATVDGAWPQIAGLTATAAWTGHAGGGILGHVGWDLEAGTLLRLQNDDVGALHRVADTTVAHQGAVQFTRQSSAAATFVAAHGLVGTRPGPGHRSDHPALDVRALTADVRDRRLHLDLRLGSIREWPAQTVEHWIDLDSSSAAWRIVHRHGGEQSRVILVPCGPSCDPAQATALPFAYVDGSIVRMEVPLSALGVGASEITHRIQASSLLVLDPAVRQGGAAAQTRELFDSLPPAPPLLLA